MTIHEIAIDKLRTALCLVPMGLILMLLVSGCTPAYPLRTPADLVPVSASQPSALAGSYRNRPSQGQDAMILRLWNGLTGRDDRPARSTIVDQYYTSDAVRIEVVSSTELRVRRMAKGVEEESVSVQGYFKDSYFYIEPRTSGQNIVIICDITYIANRVGLAKDTNLILDEGSGGVGLFFGIIPIFAAPAANPVATRTYQRVRAATTQTLMPLPQAAVELHAAGH